MRGIAERMANAGFSVEVPLLPGHGTSVEDMIPTRFDDWSAAAEAAYRLLGARTASRSSSPVSRWAAPWPAGWPSGTPRSPGSCWSTPSSSRSAPSWPRGVAGLARGRASTPSTPSAPTSPRRASTERSYPATPIAPLLSLFDGRRARSRPTSAAISCPVLLFSSLEDHVVPPVERSAPGGQRSAGPSSRSSWSAATTWPPWTTTHR